MCPAAHPSPLLGVSRSVNGRRWVKRLDRAGEALAERLVQMEGLADMLARIVAARGIEPAALQAFLHPRLRDWLPDPATLTDMDRAVSRLALACQRGEQVAIFGDYDVDGACASALLADVLEQAGCRTQIHIPDRLTEGYGPNSEAISDLARDGATMLVTVDCGTTSHEPLAHAARLGLDVVVIDHHQAPPDLPPTCGLVNPNRQDDLSGLGHLCAAGVTFMVLIGLLRHLRQAGHWAAGQGAGSTEPDLLTQLDLVALATVADVVPLTGLNRAFVRQGLQVLRGRGRPGLAALIDVSRLTGPPEAWHLGFLLGPRINAGGRIGDAALGARLLRCRDADEARRLAGQLDDLNRARQEIERAAVDEAMAQVLARHARTGGAPQGGGDGNPDEALLLAASADWHPGVVGLVAARLKERFQRPAFALALPENSPAVGSGRSISGVDLGRAVRAAVEAGLLIKGGGHAMAAGLTMDPAQLEPFRAWMSAYLETTVTEARAHDAMAIDGVMTARGASVSLAQDLAAAGPFGSGAPEPVFAFPDHRISEATVVGTGGHVRCRLVAGDGAKLTAVAFRAADHPLGKALLGLREGGSAHLAGSLAIDRWGGGERVELRVIDLAPASQPTARSPSD